MVGLGCIYASIMTGKFTPIFLFISHCVTHSSFLLVCYNLLLLQSLHLLWVQVFFFDLSLYLPSNCKTNFLFVLFDFIMVFGSVLIFGLFENPPHGPNSNPYSVYDFFFFVWSFLCIVVLFIFCVIFMEHLQCFT